MRSFTAVSKHRQHMAAPPILASARIQLSGGRSILLENACSARRTAPRERARRIARHGSRGRALRPIALSPFQRWAARSSRRPRAGHPGAACRGVPTATGQPNPPPPRTTSPIPAPQNTTREFAAHGRTHRSPAPAFPQEAPALRRFSASRAAPRDLSGAFAARAPSARFRLVRTMLPVSTRRKPATTARDKPGTSGPHGRWSRAGDGGPGVRSGTNPRAASLAAGRPTPAILLKGACQ